MYSLYLLSNDEPLRNRILNSIEVQQFDVQVFQISSLDELILDEFLNPNGLMYRLLVVDDVHFNQTSFTTSLLERTFVVYTEEQPEFLSKLVKNIGIFKNYISLSDFSVRKLLYSNLNQALLNESRILEESNHNILIVDDVTSNLTLLESFLKSPHITIFKASSAMDAMQIVFEHEIHLLILDVQLPQIGGYDLARYLKQNTFTKSIPIIFLTAFNKEPEQVVKGLDHGAIDYLYKPVDKQVLNKKVASLLRIFDYQIMLQNKNEQLEQQKKIIEEKNRLMLENIDYAAKVQQSILPFTHATSIPFSEFEVLYKPKDVVSGDFYSVKQMGDMIFCTVFDCTGHGVSGALMSAAVNSVFNEVLDHTSQMTSPAIILNAFYDKLLTNINTQSENKIFRDGADVALCMYDIKHKTLKYAGLNINLWNYSSNGASKGVHKFQATRGISYSNIAPFEDHVIQVKPGDRFILFTDGLTDQLGGEHYEKLKSKFLEELMLKSPRQSFSSLITDVQEKFESWKTDQDQTDDVCLLAFSF